MFDYIYQWMQRVAYYLVIVTALLHIVPNPEYRRYIRFFTGLILVLLLAGPILSLFDSGIDINGLYDRSAYEKQLEETQSFLDELQMTDDPSENPSGNSSHGTISVEEIKIGR